jgi:hypothetical protein
VGGGAGAPLGARARGLDFRGVVTLAPGSHLGTLVRRDPAAIGVLGVVGAAAVDPAIRLERVLSDQALALMPHVRRECVFDHYGIVAPSTPATTAFIAARLRQARQ